MCVRAGLRFPLPPPPFAGMFGFYGFGSWIAFAPNGNLIVPEYDLGRLQEVNVLTQTHVRFIAVDSVEGPTGVRVCARCTLRSLESPCIWRHKSGKGVLPRHVYGVCDQGRGVLAKVSWRQTLSLQNPGTLGGRTASTVKC